MSQQFVIHYRLDNVARTPGRCGSDHEIERGDVIDVRDERAVVVSCLAVNVTSLRTANQGQRHITNRKD